MSAPLNCDEYERLAETLVAPGPWAFLSGGAGDESTLRANRAAFQRWTFRPRVLIAVAAVTTETTVLGAAIASPVLVAPVAYQRLFHPDGEMGVARAAAAEGTVMCTSTMTTYSHRDLADAAPGLLQWAQLYVLSFERVPHAGDLAATGDRGSGHLVELRSHSPEQPCRLRDLLLAAYVDEKVQVLVGRHAPTLRRCVVSLPLEESPVPRNVRDRDSTPCGESTPLSYSRDKS